MYVSICRERERNSSKEGEGGWWSGVEEFPEVLKKKLCQNSMCQT